MATIRIDCVVGARPNFIKMASIIREMRRRDRFLPRLIHTGQHYSPEMSQAFFQDLDLPEPDINLGIGGGSQTQQTAEIMLKIEPELLRSRPAILLVVGDVNSTLAASLVAAKLGIRIAHVEAGLRSFDRTMPEEINRVVTDSLADYLFASEPAGVKNLLAEGVPPEKIHFTGNVMIDTLLAYREKAAQSTVLERFGLQARRYAVATLHRPSNVDDPARLESFIEMLRQLSAKLPVIFPVHPRTRARMSLDGIAEEKQLLLVPPQGYLDFLRLLSDARLVLTDSGGIQEETTILQVPCLTLRENTERPATVESGTNRLVGVDPSAILKTAGEILESRLPAGKIPDLWDGQAASRIFDVLEAA